MGIASNNPHYLLGEIMFNINELKLGEVAEIEKLSGKPIAALADNEVPRGLLLQAIVYVVQKREDPKYKFVDAGEVSMDEAMSLLVGDDKSDTGEE